MYHLPMMNALDIEPVEVRRRLDGGEDLLLLDWRTEEEWATCHIDGALLIPLQEMSLRVEELESHREDSIVVYCHKGARSMIITRLLRHIGFTDVRSMQGGIDRWAAEIDPDMPTY